LVGDYVNSIAAAGGSGGALGTVPINDTAPVTTHQLPILAVVRNMPAQTPHGDSVLRKRWQALSGIVSLTNGSHSLSMALSRTMTREAGNLARQKASGSPEISHAERGDPFRFADVLQKTKSAQHRFDDMNAALSSDEFAEFAYHYLPGVDDKLGNTNALARQFRRSRDTYRALHGQAAAKFGQATGSLELARQAIGVSRDNAGKMHELNVPGFGDAIAAAGQQLVLALRNGRTAHMNVLLEVERHLHDTLTRIEVSLTGSPYGRPLDSALRALVSISSFLKSLPHTESIAGMHAMIDGLAHDVQSVMRRETALKQRLSKLAPTLRDQLHRLNRRIREDVAVDEQRLSDSAELLKEAAEAICPPLNDCMRRIANLDRAFRRLDDGKFTDAWNDFNEWMARLMIDVRDADNTKALLAGDLRDAPPFFEPTDIPHVAGHEFFHRVPDPAMMDESTVEHMLVHSVIANAFYFDGVTESMLEAERLIDGNPELQAPAWQPVSDKATLGQMLNLDDFHVLDDGRLIHADTDQVIQIWRNDETEQIVVGFGGSSSGDVKGNIFARTWHNLFSTVEHWAQNLAHPLESSLLGGAIPANYPVAAEIVGSVADWMRKTPATQQYALSVTGHSKGANEACYAALQNDVPGFCFCTPAFGNTLFNSIPDDKKANAPRLVHHFLIEDDIVPDLAENIAKVLALAGIDKRVHHAGTAYQLPRGSAPRFGGVGSHEYFHTAVVEFGRARFGS
jgi:hypothetical protein